MQLTINDVLEHWKVDVVIDESKLSSELIRVPMLHAKYLEYFIFFKQKLANTDAKKNKMGYLRKRYYRGELTQQELIDNDWPQFQGLKMSNTEVQHQFEIDPILINLKRIVEEYKTSVTGLEYILNSIKSRDYSLKAMIEYQKYLSGN
jgi:hypothetical protein